MLLLSYKHNVELRKTILVSLEVTVICNFSSDRTASCFLKRKKNEKELRKNYDNANDIQFKIVNRYLLFSVLSIEFQFWLVCVFRKTWANATQQPNSK